MMAINPAAADPLSDSPHSVAGAAPSPMCLARVVYTRVETRLNPDYQVLGWSPTAAALVSSRALDGFFHGLLGQPDTLAGFERACVFAPIEAPLGAASTAPIWVAGVARVSDKPDRHGRRGILNYSALLLTQAQAAAVGYDPWPLFEPAVCEEAFPFIDDPEARVADFEWTPPQPQPAEADEATGPLRAVLAALRGTRCILLQATDAQAAAHEVEQAVRAVHTALPAAERAQCPFLTWSFRPATSAARLKLLGAAARVALPDDDWRRVATSWQPSTPVAVWRQRAAAARQAATAEPVATTWDVRRGGGRRYAVPARVAAAGGDQAANARRRWLTRPAVAVPLALVIVLLLAVWVRELLLPTGAGADGERTGTADGDGEWPDTADIPAPNAQVVELDGQARDTAEAAAAAVPSSLPRNEQAALAEWWQQWQASDLRQMTPACPAARPTFARFAEPFRQWLREAAPADPADWPETLRRLSLDVALTGWRLDGRDEADVGIAYRFAVQPTLPAGHRAQPLRLDYVPAGATLPTRFWRLTQPITAKMTAERRPSPTLAFAPGEAGGLLRARALVWLGESEADGDGAAADETTPIEIAGRLTVPKLSDVLTATAAPQLVLRDEHGRGHLVLRLSHLRVVPTAATRRAGFPACEVATVPSHPERAGQ